MEERELKSQIKEDCKKFFPPDFHERKYMKAIWNLKFPDIIMDEMLEECEPEKTHIELVSFERYPDIINCIRRKDLKMITARQRELMQQSLNGDTFTRNEVNEIIYHINGDISKDTAKKLLISYETNHN